MAYADGISLTQASETPVQTGRNGAFTWRYAYARSADSRAGGDPGQDYLTLRHNGPVFAFAVCDGVSQSFFGDLAARYLGDTLVEWLWERLEPGSNEQQIQQSLGRLLRDITAAGTDMVSKQPLPEEIPPMLADVLEQKRAMGSEAAFICGKLIAPSLGRTEGMALLAWMGDLRLRLWGKGGDLAAGLHGTFRTFERWSTRRGPVESEPHVLLLPLRAGERREIEEITVYSDGLSLLDSFTRPPGAEEVSALIGEAQRAPTSDDISFLSVRVG